ncbi:ubiquinone biosynthesis protein (plasmid) [Legionella adelaidensis]|uniref:3-demethoxyubiquinol 3-hydroxylase n=1 Tax=Legionella adelaidensis TaxID=45056 RepID=A0A0W0R1D9_9GAMM|nr:2-polyprenyl-3-methyl-6-methoxy-1,4-benzoquinone monooxygenase [Legionella adelaidensis]KTC64869.1 ubiquinone biosynthesis protein [Legionella adelaidensis]VEH82960.1 ubiquinone biosynthesis protein [Legionella adelaidensis]
MKIFKPVEELIINFDSLLRSVFVPQNRFVERSSPALNMPEPQLNHAEKKHVAGLMRVNHAGEVCAQALYQGQALTAKLPGTRKQMEKAAREEVDHLGWCELRLNELGSQPSILNLIWYTQSFLIGALAGLAGDQWSLGFVVETERQVTAHLEDHIQKLPKLDEKTQIILKKMQEEEIQHAELARKAGAKELPRPIQELMRLMSKVMTKTSYYI